MTDTINLGNAKPAAQSRTLRFNRLVTWGTGVAAVLPDIVGFVLDLLGDPNVAKSVSEFIPGRSRALLFAIVAAVALRNRSLRYQTTQPITKA
jgi:hypothetical protein